MTIERRLHQNLAGTNPHAPRIARLIDRAGDDNERIGIKMPVPRHDVATRDRLPTRRHLSQQWPQCLPHRSSPRPSSSPKSIPFKTRGPVTAYPITRIWRVRRMLGRLGTALVMLAMATPALAAPDDASILRRQAQELVDAVSNGDAKVWDKYLDPDVIFIDEASEVSNKAGLLPQIKPLPEGISGSIQAEVSELHVVGDIAVMRVDQHESENYFGHAIKAEYRSLQTWRRTSDGWKLIGQQTLATLIDPPAITLPAARLDEYVGTYRLNAQITYTLRRDGDKLIGQRSGRDPVTLSIEACDVFFVPGQPRSRKIILRDASGCVTGLTDRREGRDIVWTREK